MSNLNLAAEESRRFLGSMLNAQSALIKSQIESAYAYAGGCIDDAALWLQMFVNYISKVAISMWKQNP